MINITNTIPCASKDIVYINERKPYLAISNSLVNHILFNNLLSDLEKIYYLLTDFYSKINNKFALRETEKSAKEWSTLLCCSEEWIFKMQKKLEALKYFQIIREKDEDNQNEKNIIIPTLPDSIFYELAKEPNRKGQENFIYSREEHESYKRNFLDDSKMFIMFNLKMIKLLLSDNNLTTLQKLIWIYFFGRSHRAYTDSCGEGTRNFITTYQDIANIFSCKENTISIAINKLFDLGYISKKQFRIKEQGKTGRRRKKSCWEIAALFPQGKIESLLKQPDRQNLAPLTLDDLKLYSLGKLPTNKQPASYSINYHDRSADSHGTTQYNNKNNILNIKNIDTWFSTANHTTEENKSYDVFCEQNLLASSNDVSLGLQITEQFNKRTLKLANHIDYPQAIKQADAALTIKEHWLVNKTAYTLQHKLDQAVNFAGIKSKSDDPEIIKIKEKIFNPTEQILIDLWNDFINMPNDKLPQEEFLLRPSWLLKLLPQQTLTCNIVKPMPEIILQKENSINSTILPGDKEDKARKFAFALRNRKLAKGYAAEISIEELVLEFIHHAATWRPTKLNCKTREAQINAALSFAWKAAEQGRWKCPYPWLNAQIQQREQQAKQWKHQLS